MNACTASCSRPVHPRVCGERSSRSELAVLLGGSSPRVRGTPSRAAGAAIANRFIPACAGNARCVDALFRYDTVHPRVCGERPAASMGSIASAGSSPRVRGTRVLTGPRGIIASVHPRVCGERSPLAAAEEVSIGSSPRVRGTRQVADRSAEFCRFIPACAGNAGPAAAAAPAAAVHPRVCGERPAPPASAFLDGGSSPRVRGTLGWPDDGSRARRFIPACAGNACRRASTPPARSVHPRVCGERRQLRQRAAL